MLAWGKNLRNANRVGVASTVSPIDRKRITNTLRTPDDSQRAGARGFGAASSGCRVEPKWRTLGDDSIISRRLFISRCTPQACKVRNAPAQLKAPCIPILLRLLLHRSTSREYRHGRDRRAYIRRTSNHCHPLSIRLLRGTPDKPKSPIIAH